VPPGHPITTPKQQARHRAGMGRPPQGHLHTSQASGRPKEGAIAPPKGGSSTYRFQATQESCRTKEGNPKATYTHIQEGIQIPGTQQEGNKKHNSCLGRPKVGIEGRRILQGRKWHEKVHVYIIPYIPVCANTAG